MRVRPVLQTCVVPVARKDGSGYDNLRSCIDGPVFNPARVLWDRWLSERPDDAADASRGSPGGALVAGVKRSLAVDPGRDSSLPTPVMSPPVRRAPAGSSRASSTCARSAPS